MLGLVGALAGCVVAPRPGHYRVYPPRVSVGVWVPFPIYFVPMYPGYYESRGQRDRDECYRAAVRETGIDPGMAPLRDGDTARGGGEVALAAAGGAAVGGVLASPGHAGQGMVIGALLGAVAGAAAAESREARERAEQARRDRVQSESTRAEQEHFRRAMADCMAARGYRQR
jgi:hypothetical protein